MENQTMTLSESESVQYEYNVYYSSTGDKYFAIGELSVDNVRSDSPLAEFTQTHYSQIEMFYWLLVVFMMFYLITTYIAAPLYYGYRQKTRAKNATD